MKLVQPAHTYAKASVGGLLRDLAGNNFPFLILMDYFCSESILSMDLYGK
jgi:hypothetical protein